MLVQQQSRECSAFVGIYTRLLFRLFAPAQIYDKFGVKEVKEKKVDDGSKIVLTITRETEKRGADEIIAKADLGLSPEQLKKSIEEALRELGVDSEIQFVTDFAAKLMHKSQPLEAPAVLARRLRQEARGAAPIR